MRRHDQSFKLKRDWEAEMLECLEEAKKELAEATADQRPMAFRKYREVLAQFNDLTLRGKIPPKEPCYQ